MSTINILIKIVKKIKPERGDAIIICAFAMTALLAITSLTTDVGLTYYNRSKLQTAVDAAALAAVVALPDETKATQTAKEYIQKNGVTVDTIEVIFLENDTKIRVSATQKTNTLFGNVCNIKSISNDVSAAAVKETQTVQPTTVPAPIPQPTTSTSNQYYTDYPYRILQASSTDTFKLGGKYTINGCVHSNGNLYSSPGKGLINGNFESCGKNDVNVYTTTINGSVIDNAAFVDMPDFSGVISTIVPTTWDFVGTVDQYYKHIGKNSWDSPITVTGNVKIIGNITTSNWIINGNLYIDGNATMGWSSITLKSGSIYCSGNLTFANTVSAIGCIFAKGNIVFHGAMSQIPTNNSTVSVYSENGNIEMSAAGTEIYGVVYAPNGSVHITGNTLKYYGSIIANTITGIPADLIMGENTHALPYVFPDNTKNTTTEAQTTATSQGNTVSVNQRKSHLVE